MANVLGKNFSMDRGLFRKAYTFKGEWGQSQERYLLAKARNIYARENAGHPKSV